MKSELPISMLFALLLAAQPSFGDPFEPRCCACLPSGPDLWRTGVPAGMEPTRALLCAEISSSAQESQFFATCEDRGGGKPLCVATLSANAAIAQDGDNLDCDAILLEENIACPSAAPAPVLGAPALGGLGLLLAGLGTWTVRRRRALSPRPDRA